MWRNLVKIHPQSLVCTAIYTSPDWNSTVSTLKARLKGKIVYSEISMHKAYWGAPFARHFYAVHLVAFSNLIFNINIWRLLYIMSS